MTLRVQHHRSLTLSAAVLQGAPSLSNWNGEVAVTATTVDLGQRGHSLNASGYGSWPYILAFEFASDTLMLNMAPDSNQRLSLETLHDETSYQYCRTTVQQMRHTFVLDNH